jgi:holo-[acyl-carrier protein] synthase
MPAGLGQGVILGIGHDICSITRIQNILETHADRFLSRIFTEAEKAEASTRAHLATYVAGRFAAKEAVYKALNAADQTKMSWRNAEILTGHKGIPVLSLNGGCHDGLMSLEADGATPRIHLSLSHDGGLASALVIVSSITDK